MPLRDIRPDLLDRLAEVGAERKRAEEIERSLRDLLSVEDRRWGHPEQHTLFEAPTLEKKTLPRTKKGVVQSQKTIFLQEALADDQIWSVDHLAETAVRQGVDFGGKSPGRALHFILLGMQQRGLAVKVGGGEWKRGTPKKENGATTG